MYVCIPYFRHTKAMIERLKAAGLGYHVAAEKTHEKLGKNKFEDMD